MAKIYKRSIPKTAEDKNTLIKSVAGIIDNVIKDGDNALKKYNYMFDKNKREDFKITREEINEAYSKVDAKLIEDINIAANNIRKFAVAQKEEMKDCMEKEIYPGVLLGHKRIPVNSCCCYVPGGRYPLFSTALMLSIPARVAGVKRIAACSPTIKGTEIIHPSTLVALDIAGVDEIYAVGGAHSIAAFSYGTEQIKPVDIIVGPGNRYVTEAKRQCYGQVGIDFIAGPSEVLVIADETANAEFIAADLLAQSEHDINAKGILITTSEKLAASVEIEIKNILEKLPTADIAKSSWEQNGEIVIVKDIDEAADIANDYAPEHLEISIHDYYSIMPKLKNYGSLFIGEMSAEVFGDYVSGTNHTLPTLKAAKYTGGVWVGTFLKTCTHQILKNEAIKSLGPVASRMAKAEGLYGHAYAADVRLKFLDKD